MGYERYPRNTGVQGDRYGGRETQAYGRDEGSNRDQGYSSERDDRIAGYGRDDDHNRYGEGRDQDRYRQREDGQSGYAQREQQQRGYNRDYGSDQGQARDAGGGEYHGSYASDGRRFENVGARRDQDDDNRRAYGADRSRGTGQQQGYGRQPQGYDYEDRGFFVRAGDEVKSWFGDEGAEKRREYDTRYDQRSDRGNASDHGRDDHYGSWRKGQISALDRDYDEYRREHRSKFENEFSSWRSNRQTQRDALGKVEEHMDVVGSDGTHVGTVDKVRGDRILLTKTDKDADGRHHSIPSSWLQTVDTKVTLSKSGDEAKKHWRDEERNQAMFGDETGKGNEPGRDDTTGRDAKGKMLNRSFSGTY